jgi:T5orf172 domain
MSLFDQLREKPKPKEEANVIESIPMDIEPSNEGVKDYEFTSLAVGWQRIVLKANSFKFEILGPCNEWTYIMEDYSYGAFKIGKTTTQPEMRLKQFQTGNPSIKLVMAFPSTYFSESELHKKFKAYRKVEDNHSGREWFYKVPDLTAFVSYHVKLSEKAILLYEAYREFNAMYDNSNS